MYDVSQKQGREGGDSENDDSLASHLVGATIYSPSRAIH